MAKESLSTARKYPEVQVETKLQEFRPFTDQEKEALIRDGAVILSLTGEAIEGQIASGRLFGHVVVDRRDRLFKLPSLKAEVAIYPDPRRFFIPRSGNKKLPEQEELAKKDGQNLRERLSLKDDSVDVIIPDQASTFTELVFQYLDRTTKQGKGVWLFGRDYNNRYGRTRNLIERPPDYSPYVAVVGHDPSYGVRIDIWHPDFLGHKDVRVVRLVVARKK